MLLMQSDGNLFIYDSALSARLRGAKMIRPPRGLCQLTIRRKFRRLRYQWIGIWSSSGTYGTFSERLDMQDDADHDLQIPHGAAARQPGISIKPLSRIPPATWAQGLAGLEC